MSDKKTAIVTGAHQGIGAGLVEDFLNRGYNVVATSLRTLLRGRSRWKIAEIKDVVDAVLYLVQAG